LGAKEKGSAIIMEVTLASEEQIPAIEQMMALCIEEMNKQGIFQWDDNYPNRKTFLNGIVNHHLYVLSKNREIVGIVIINEKQNSGWEKINWNYNNENILVVHSLAINTKYQKQGYGKYLLKFCEIFAKENGYKLIRLDTYSGNEGANKLYRNEGYEKAGEIEYSFKPEGHRLYYCYDKLIV
jgi:ribosomal protein S18 acetylase RimI-like enzyme